MRGSVRKYTLQGLWCWNCGRDKRMLPRGDRVYCKEISQITLRPMSQVVRGTTPTGYLCKLEGYWPAHLWARSLCAVLISLRWELCCGKWCWDCTVFPDYRITLQFASLSNTSVVCCCHIQMMMGHPLTCSHLHKAPLLYVIFTYRWWWTLSMLVARKINGFCYLLQVY